MAWRLSKGEPALGGVSASKGGSVSVLALCEKRFSLLVSLQAARARSIYLVAFTAYVDTKYRTQLH
jgi:hypothetical protein